MLTDHRSRINYRIYETGIITATLSGAGNRQAKGGRRIGKKQKHYYIDKKIIRSTIIRQFNLKKNSIKFLVLTFPKPVKNEYANQCFSKFVENLSKNYKLNSYVSVKELHKSGAPHFHVFLDIKYCSFNSLNRAWVHTFENDIGFSINALRSGAPNKSCIIKNIQKAVRYATKYVTKMNEYKLKPEYTNVTQKQWDDYETNRLFFCSRNVLSKGYLIISGLIDYLRNIPDKIKMICDTDYYQVYYINRFTPDLYWMRQFVKNYEFFVLLFKSFRSFILFFMSFPCFFLFYVLTFGFNSQKKQRYVLNFCKSRHICSGRAWDYRAV